MQSTSSAPRCPYRIVVVILVMSCAYNTGSSSESQVVLLCQGTDTRLVCLHKDLLSSFKEEHGKRKHVPQHQQGPIGCQSKSTKIDARSTKLVYGIECWPV